MRHGYQTQELEAYRQRRLLIDDPVARRCARLRLSDRRSALDALIAATVLQHDVIQVARNLNDFQRMGVMLLNPWTA
ncbi:PIN domain-containing protein [Pantoea ananatis]|uniref:PIN domain-containing protein n=1 Tax=Pantoea ananas TaxID=553 RepID=UPI0021F72D89|nr:PIN domain-containing protein [Pantoea ananatis]